MGYRTRPRYQAQIHSRSEERDSTLAPGGTPSAPTGHSSAPGGTASAPTGHSSAPGGTPSAPNRIFSAPKPEGRWEPRQVLEALHDMHNAPAENSPHGRQGGI